MQKIIAIALLALGLAGCGVVDSFVDGFKQAKAVEQDLEQSTGLKPSVGFNFNNGRLRQVTVAYPGTYEARPLRELADAARVAIRKEFKQTPENIVLAFSLGRGEAVN